MSRSLVLLGLLAACSDASKPPTTTDTGPGVVELDASSAPDAMSESGTPAKDAASTVDASVVPDSATTDARMTAPPDSAIVAPQPLVTALELGPISACLIRTEQTLCWGAVLGSLPARTTSTPTPVAGLGKTSAVSVGSRHACAIDTQTRCWGSSIQAMYPSGVGSRTEAAVNVGEPARTVAAGLNHTCVLETSGIARCWGEIATGLADTLQLDSGSTHVCAVNLSNRVFCWGDNGVGQVTGTPGGSVRNAWQLSFRNVLSVSAGESRTCARLASHEVTCWGGPDPFQPILGLQDTVEISVGDAISCARSTAGAVDCWDGTYGLTAVRVIVAGATHVSAGTERACASMEDGNVLCWNAGAAPVLLEN